ncbi:chondroitinase family polysaccharide lyase [Streptomyces sp. NPDC008317]|uniref:chondroitinase family polysaccharide lyase n=1 Tax=Streptomyces sp. NPDC008317 TaxID=3364827 RepID=UPI0036E3B263
MPEQAQGFTRRKALIGAALGSAAAALPVAAAPAAADSPAANGAAAGPPGQAADAPTVEDQALALDPPVFLFETRIPEHLRTGPGSRVSISAATARIGPHSLRWDYRPGAELEIRTPLRYAPDAYRDGDDQATMGTVDTFAVWIHNDRALDDVLRVEFGRGRRADAWCDIHLGFTGWRTVWIRYGYDLSGKPRAGMDTLRFVAPRRSGAGTFHLDQLIVNTELRPDHPTRDRQVPFVNREGDRAANAHWLALLSYADRLAAHPLPTPEPTAGESASLAEVTRRYHAVLRKSLTVDDAAVAALAAATDGLGVPYPGERAPGRAVDSYQTEIYPPRIAAALNAFVAGSPLRQVTDLMYQIACAYDAASHDAHRTRLTDLYVRILDHLREQGWAAGSCQGTIHHLGYQFRGFYDSVHLIRDALAERGLLDGVREDLAWFTGLGRLLQDFGDAESYGGIFDILNTNLQGMLGTALLMPTPAGQVAHLHALRRWLDAALTVSPGIMDGFKADGSVFHHLGMYPDYARDGYKGSAPTVDILSGTAFRVGEAAHGRYKDALLRMRVYANASDWPLSLAARHPTGLTALALPPYQSLTTAGSPDGSRELDPEVGAAFLRLLPAKPSSVQKALAQRLAAAGVTAEAAPTGSWAMNHSALALHRRDNWLVAVRGHSRYLWSTEIYATDNLYGRYTTYGQIQVLGRGDPVDNLASGFRQPGWDWNQWPGTTAIRLPYEELRSNLAGAIEQMPLTESRFGGAGTIDDRHAVFAIDLREHPVFNPSHRARKSVFLFDERVIALGSGIRNDDSVHPTRTTLFQCHLAEPSEPVIHSALGAVADFPYAVDRTPSDPTWLIDPVGNGYWIPPGQRLALTRASQTAPDQSTGTPGTADFATAWLDHGSAPRGGRYAYALIVDATPEDMREFAARMADPTIAPYSVLRHDDGAHVVHDRATGITAYAVFEPQRTLAAGGPIAAVDTPSLLLARPDSGGLVLSVTDPDLRLYEGRDRDQYDRNGAFVGVLSPFSRPWRDSRGGTHRLRLVLRGAWRTAEPHTEVRTAVHGGLTSVDVRCHLGLGVQIRLRSA